MCFIIKPNVNTEKHDESPTDIRIINVENNETVRNMRCPMSSCLTDLFYIFFLLIIKLLCEKKIDYT